MKYIRWFLMLVVISLLFSGCKLYYKAFYTDPQQCFKKAAKNFPYDVIIVPGFPSDSGKLNTVLEERIKWATYLYKNKFTKNIIFSGAAVYSPYVESEIMKTYVSNFDVPVENIFTETKAEHTTENLYYGYVLAKDLGFNKIAFASNVAQTSFMKPFKRKFKLELDFLPIIDDTIRKIKPQFKVVNPPPSAINNFVPITERQNKLQRIRGTRGHKVKKEIKRLKKAKQKS